MVVLPFLAICFMVRKGFVYTIALDIYAFRLAFSGKNYCILHHFSLRLAAYCTAFSTKLHCILLQMAQNMVQMAFLLNKYSSCRIHSLPPFCTKTNPRENRFFAARWAIGGKNRSHNVKVLAEKWTKRSWYVREHRQWHEKHVRLQQPGATVAGLTLKVNTALSTR